MKRIIILLYLIVVTFTAMAQLPPLKPAATNTPAYKFTFKAHKPSMLFTAVQGLSDGFRDASMFGRIKNAGLWFNGIDSWKLKYENGNPADGPAFFGSTTVFVMFTDAPHFSNAISNLSGEMAKVYMPDMTGATFWQKLKVVGINTLVRSAAHNLVYGLIYKPK